MKAETWLARCAAELEHLSLTRPPQRARPPATDDGPLELAGELLGSPRYLGLDPVQAARAFWRDHAAGIPLN